VSVRLTLPISEQGSGRRSSPAPDAARRSYSDVAASRPPSPVGNSDEEARSPQPPSHNVGQGNRQSGFISRIPIASPVISNKDNANNSEPMALKMNGPLCKESAVVRNTASRKRGLAVATCLRPSILLFLRPKSP